MTIVKGEIINEVLRNGTSGAAMAVLEDMSDPGADVADMIVDGGIATFKSAATGMAIKAAGTALASTGVGSTLIGTGASMAGGALTTGATAAAAAGAAVAAAPVVVIGGLIGGIFGLFD